MQRQMGIGIALCASLALMPPIAYAGLTTTLTKSIVRGVVKKEVPTPSPRQLRPHVSPGPSSGKPTSPEADSLGRSAKDADPSAGHVVDPTDASVRKSFVMSIDGQAEISSAIQNHEIQISGTEHQLFFTRSVPISQLPVDDQGRLTALFKALVSDLPEEAFKSSDTLRKAMHERLERQLAESPGQAAPRYKFDVSSGKLTLPRLGRIGSLEISGGELDTYKLFERIALVVLACSVSDCKCYVAELFGATLPMCRKLTRP